MGVESYLAIATIKKTINPENVMYKWPVILICIIVCTSLAIAFTSCDSGGDDDDSRGTIDDDDDIAGDDDTAGDDDNTGDDDTSDDDSSNDDDSTDDDDDDSGDGVWSDSSSGLMWQNGDDCYHEWGEAIAYCDSLSLAGYDDWRLPTISELRSIIRGCPDSETGGLCDVSDDCLTWDCLSMFCDGDDCIEGDGPGPEGLFWPPELDGYGGVYWSSSEVEEYSGSNAWTVFFIGGDVAFAPIISSLFVRCVRN